MRLLLKQFAEQTRLGAVANNRHELLQVSAKLRHGFTLLQQHLQRRRLIKDADGVYAPAGNLVGIMVWQAQQTSGGGRNQRISEIGHQINRFASSYAAEQIGDYRLDVGAQAFDRLLCEARADRPFQTGAIRWIEGKEPTFHYLGEPIK